MRAFWIALAMLLFSFGGSLPVHVPAHADEVLLHERAGAIVTGVVKSVDSPGALFVLEVPDKGDMIFRVSPETRFEKEVLGGVIEQKLDARLAALMPGSKVSVTYMTQPPHAPVATEVNVWK